MNTAFIILSVLFIVYVAYNHSHKESLTAINFIQSYLDNCMEAAIVYNKSKEFKFFLKPHKKAVSEEFQKFFEKILTEKVRNSTSFSEALDILNSLRKKDRGTTVIPASMVREIIKNIISRNVAKLSELAQKYLEEKGYSEISLLATYCRPINKEDEEFSEPQKWQVIALICFQYPEIKAVLEKAFEKLKSMTKMEVDLALSSGIATDQTLAELSQRTHILPQDRTNLINELKSRKEFITQYFKNIPDFEKNLARDKFLNSLHILKEKPNGIANKEDNLIEMEVVSSDAMSDDLKSKVV